MPPEPAGAAPGAPRAVPLGPRVAVGGDDADAASGFDSGTTRTSTLGSLVCTRTITSRRSTWASSASSTARWRRRRCAAQAWCWRVRWRSRQCGTRMPRRSSRTSSQRPGDGGVRRRVGPRRAEAVDHLEQEAAEELADDDPARPLALRMRKTRSQAVRGDAAAEADVAHDDNPSTEQLEGRSG